MTNLTEKWDKGKLPEGDYYIKRRNGSTLYDNIDSHGVWRNSIDEDIIEVLAEVPSYEEWEKLNWYAGNGVEENAELKERLKKTQELELELRKENTKLKTENKWYSEQLNEAVKEVGQLKELLKEANNWLKAYYAYEQSDFVREQVKQCLTKTKQVLGEE